MLFRGSRDQPADHAALPAFAQSLTPRTPGLWQVDSTVTMALMGGTQKRSDKLCITPELATRDVAPPNALQDDGWKCASSLVGSPLRQNSCRPNRISTMGGDKGWEWQGTDRSLRTER
jgi:hypothetical protein